MAAQFTILIILFSSNNMHFFSIIITHPCTIINGHKYNVANVLLDYVNIIPNRITCRKSLLINIIIHIIVINVIVVKAHDDDAKSC